MGVKRRKPIPRSNGREPATSIPPSPHGYRRMNHLSTGEISIVPEIDDLAPSDRLTRIWWDEWRRDPPPWDSKERGYWRWHPRSVPKEEWFRKDHDPFPKGGEWRPYRRARDPREEREILDYLLRERMRLLKSIQERAERRSNYLSRMLSDAGEPERWAAIRAQVANYFQARLDHARAQRALVATGLDPFDAWGEALRRDPNLLKKTREARLDALPRDEGENVADELLSIEILEIAVLAQNLSDWRDMEEADEIVRDWAFAIGGESSRERGRRLGTLRHRMDDNRSIREELHAEIRKRGAELMRKHGPHSSAAILSRDELIQERARQVNHHKPYSLSAIKRILRQK